MKIESDHGEDLAADEAIEWVILLRENRHDLDLRRRFEAWLDYSARNRKAWADVGHTYEVLREVANNVASQSNVWSDFICRPIHLSKGILKVFQILQARPLAFASALSVIGLVFFLSVGRTWYYGEISTRTGQVTTKILADGSSVLMGPSSVIRVSYSDHERTVELVRGDVWFHARHDPARAFHVVTRRGIRLTDIGTAFEVRLDNKSLQVEVDQGTVSLSSRNTGAISLNAGDAAVVDAIDGRLTEQYDVPSGDVASWRDGQFVVHDRPVDEVINTVRRYYHGLILVRGDESKHRVTGVYDLTDPPSAIDTLSQVEGISVRHLTPWCLIVYIS